MYCWQNWWCSGPSTSLLPRDSPSCGSSEDQAMLSKPELFAGVSIQCKSLIIWYLEIINLD